MDIPYTEEHHGYTIKIDYDSHPESPREWDNVGTMVCFHPRYRLGDEHDYKSVASFFIDRMRECSEESIRKIAKYIESKNEYFAADCELADIDVDDTDIDELADFLEEYIGSHNRELHEFIAGEYPGIILPLYLYDHSGITMNTTGFSCGWDSGQVGWIYCTEEEIKEEWGEKKDVTGVEPRTRAEECLRGEVETYDHFIRGLVYCYTVTDEDEDVVDSCYGFFEEDEFDPQHTLSEARSAVAYELNKKRKQRHLDRQFLSAPCAAD